LQRCWSPSKSPELNGRYVGGAETFEVKILDVVRQRGQSSIISSADLGHEVQ
jgi:hypothetical protein